MNTEIKKYADAGDIKSLKYIFVDSLDVDPTFVRYEEEYNYCKSVPGLLEAHIELTPFRTNKADWNEAYWTSLKMDLLKNFSDRRMSHMREVAKVFLAEKVQRILAERSTTNSAQEVPFAKVEPTSVPIQKAEYVAQKVAEPVKRTTSMAAEQARQLEEEKRKLEAENKAQAALRDREAKERAARIEQQRREQARIAAQSGGGVPKKAIGIVAAAVTVAVVLFLLLK